VVPNQRMSKDVNGKPAQECSSNSEPKASYASLIEEHAAQLMDDLFQELTPDLDPSIQPSVNSSHAQLQAPSSLVLRLPVEDDTVLEGLVVPFVEMDATFESLFPPLTPEPLPRKASEGLTSKILLSVACLSFVGSACLWLGLQFNRSSVNPAIAQVPAVIPAVSPENAAFAEDLKQSLQDASTSPAIAQSSPLAIPTAVSNASAPSAPSGLFAANLPTTTATALPTAIGSMPVLSSPSVNLPVRNAPNAAHTVAMSNLAHRKLASPPSVNFTATKTTPATRLPTLTAAVLPTINLPNVLPNGTTNASPASSSHVPPVGQPVGRTAKAGITVQGILDLGDKSAILVARNGSTQNVRMGEVLDSSGWVFLRIENGQAIIQRGSEVRSVSGGEQF
jgi:hypothetical protein